MKGAEYRISFEELLQTLDALPVTRNDLDKQLASLYKDWLLPIEEHLSGELIQEVTVIPHHYSHLIPFHALGPARAALLDRYDVDYAPSFALCAISSRRRLEQTGSRDGLIVADPDGSLRYAEIEADRITRILSRSTVLGGARASVEAVLAKISDYSLIHFACHAQFGPDAGSDIGLKMAPSANHSGLLSLRQILSHVALRPGSTVILSGCRTGRTVLGRSDEFIGLAGGFILAGAGAVVGSLWPVDDVSTALLMERVYQRMIGGTTHTRALRDAQLWLRELPLDDVVNVIEQWRLEGVSVCFVSTEYDDIPFAHPYYWAGFFSVGT